MPLFGRAPIRSARAESFEETSLDTPHVNDLGTIVEKESISIKFFRERLPDGSVIRMVRLPGGTFAMGSPHYKGHRDEEPLHYVKIESFLLSQTTITQEQWKAIIKKLPPCRGKGMQLPVDRVSWFEAQAFCRRLAKTCARPYRLPSEAEWEYACRAGSTTDFSFGDMITTDHANYVGLHQHKNGPKGIYRHGPVQVGSFFPNRFGLYDMHGNLDEWCEDTWHDDYVGAPLDGSSWDRGGSDGRVIRGGSWHDPPDLCRSASRLKLKPTEGEDFVGFRVALSISVMHDVAGGRDGPL